MSSEIIWLRHTHENRNDLLRFGLMKMHLEGRIFYTEKPIHFATLYGFSDKVAQSSHKGLSFLVLRKGRTMKRIIVDSEDSFIFTSEHIKECDLYFCSGYNIDFFENRQFPECLKWQNENDLNWYRQKVKIKIDTLGEHFNRVKKFVPIGPEMTLKIKRNFVQQRFFNIRNRIYFSLRQKTRWYHNYEQFDIRYKFLKLLRDEPLLHDITLYDSPWGWPRHRVNLHKKLAELACSGYAINSFLKKGEYKISDGSINDVSLHKVELPMITGMKIVNYEKMLASSRVGVFATGFHWGWRNIMMLALMVGIPVITDRLLLTPYFDMRGFVIFENEDHSWLPIKTHLDKIDEEQWFEYKHQNQQYYDSVMAPEAVAEYFLNELND
ncbi:hypothetical protein [Desertivirga xinjiangensis]|uniref:hypothetical protein n=1 Tax=Desertivirga xinjiangensis TaxID=539206 RepID=UPI00210B7A72|nr:hypothetical protein [Pedobacter xinjiangensis]